MAVGNLAGDALAREHPVADLALNASGPIGRAVQTLRIGVLAFKARSPSQPVAIHTASADIYIAHTVNTELIRAIVTRIYIEPIWC